MLMPVGLLSWPQGDIQRFDTGSSLSIIEGITENISGLILNRDWIGGNTTFIVVSKRC